MCEGVSVMSHPLYLQKELRFPPVSSVSFNMNETQIIAYTNAFPGPAVNNGQNCLYCSVHSVVPDTSMILSSPGFS